MTFWYEFYYEWMKPGKYHERIYEMHKQYGTTSMELFNRIYWYCQGPIIRVSPDEIHISDSLFYHEIFVPHNVRRTNAYSRYAQGTGFEGKTSTRESEIDIFED